MLKILEQDVKDLLNFATSNGIINLDEVQNIMKQKERQRYLEQHKYSINQRKDGRWQTTLPDEDCKSGRKLITKTSLYDLEDVVISYYKAKECMTKDITLRTLFPRWLEYKSVHTNSTSYIKRILVDWNRFYEHDSISDLSLRDMDYLTLDMWANKLVKLNGLTKKQYYNMSIILRQCLDFAVELHIIDDNCFDRIKIPSRLFVKHKKPKDDTQVFLENEQIKIRDEAERKLAQNPRCLTPVIILLNFQLGLRIGELVSIKWEDVDNNYLHIQRSEIEDYEYNANCNTTKRMGYKIVSYTKSSAGERAIFINSEAQRLLKIIKKTCLKYGYYDNGYIFISSNGTRGTSRTLTKYLYSLCQSAGISNKSSHKIRKTYISSLFDNGININTIREIAGHEDERTSLKNYCFNQKISSDIEVGLERASNTKTCLRIM